MKNYLWLFLLLSLGLHILLFAGLPSHFKNNKKAKALTKDMEVISEKMVETRKNISLDQNQSKKPPPYMKNFLGRLIVKKNIPALIKPEFAELNIKKIILSEIPHDKKLKKIPAYMDYYHIIREKIKKNAYRNYRTKDKGIIFLTFTIANNGKLENVYLDKNSINNRFLKTVALQRIQKASPFPAFPKELQKYEHLQFDISIYFKNN